MIIKSSNSVPSRRQFLFNILPAGTLFCFGYSNLSALPISENNQKASAEKHKFLEDSGFTYKDVYEFAYRDWLIPIMQSLANEIGKDEFIEMLKRTSSEIGAKSG